MLQNLTQNKTLLVAASALVILGLILILIVGLRGSGANQSALTPTVSVSDLQTAAVSTFASNLTQTALAAPTEAPTDTPVSTSTLFFFNTTGTPASGLLGPSPTSSCYGLNYVKDVTIPDGTVMAPGQTFTKTWLVKNTGTCAWQIGFKWNSILGDAMGGSAFTLDQNVSPGQQYEISVQMVAPAGKTGEDKGWWRMSTADGTNFGDQLWVDIVIGSQTTLTATSTTTTNTATATQAVTATNSPTATSNP